MQIKSRHLGGSRTTVPYLKSKLNYIEDIKASQGDMYDLTVRNHDGRTEHKRAVKATHGNVISNRNRGNVIVLQKMYTKIVTNLLQLYKYTRTVVRLS